MLTNRKLKKRLQKEADTLMQAKKEEMLAFYHPTEEKQARGRRFPVQALVAASLAVILVAAVVLAVSLHGSSPAVEPVDVSESPSAVLSEAVSKPSLDSSTESEYIYSSNEEIGPGLYSFNEPFAIAEILEITEETVRLGSRFLDDYDYTKIKCQIVYSYRTEYFMEPSNYTGFNVYNYIPFDELKEIYVVSNSVDELREHDKIFFRPDQMNLNGHLYYSPVTNRDGKAEFLTFVDGKLVIPDGALDSGSFNILEYTNEDIQWILSHENEGKHSEFFEACPKYLFEEGLDVQQVIDFLDSCKAFGEAFSAYRARESYICGDTPF